MKSRIETLSVIRLQCDTRPYLFLVFERMFNAFNAQLKFRHVRIWTHHVRLENRRFKKMAIRYAKNLLYLFITCCRVINLVNLTYLYLKANRKTGPKVNEKMINVLYSFVRLYFMRLFISINTFASIEGSQICNIIFKVDSSLKSNIYIVFI